MGRPNKGDRRHVLLRIDPALLQRVDDWVDPVDPSQTDRNDKVQTLLKLGLGTMERDFPRATLEPRQHGDTS